MTAALARVAGSPHKLREVEIAAPTVGRAQLNFGAAPGSGEARVVITGQAGIALGSSVMAQRLIAASAHHSADEHLMEDLEVDAGYIVPGVGFTIVGCPRAPVRLYGLYNVVWQWS